MPSLCYARDAASQSCSNLQKTFFQIPSSMRRLCTTLTPLRQCSCQQTRPRSTGCAMTSCSSRYAEQGSRMPLRFHARAKLMLDFSPQCAGHHQRECDRCGKSLLLFIASSQRQPVRLCGLRASKSMQERPAPLELQGLQGRPGTMIQMAAWASPALLGRLARKAVPFKFLTPHCHLFWTAGWERRSPEVNTLDSATCRSRNDISTLSCRASKSSRRTGITWITWCVLFPRRIKQGAVFPGTTMRQCQSHSATQAHQALESPARQGLPAPPRL